MSRRNEPDYPRMVFFFVCAARRIKTEYRDTVLPDLVKDQDMSFRAADDLPASRVRVRWDRMEYRVSISRDASPAACRRGVRETAERSSPSTSETRAAGFGSSADTLSVFQCV